MSLAAVGTQCKLSYDLGADHEGPLPERGDFFRAVKTGTCWMIDEVRASSVRGRVNTTCTRLGKDAVQLGEPGVWPLYWSERRRRA